MPGRRSWSADEDDFMLEMIGKYSIPYIAKTLNRSVNAVILRAYRLGISNTKAQQGYISLTELSRLCNVDMHVVSRWIDKHGLKAVKKITRNEVRFKLIKPKDFWEWAEQNKEKLNFSKIEPYSILPEPDWVEIQRKVDYHEIPKRKNQKWTPEEDRKMLALLRKGLSYEEASAFLERSPIGIQRRYLTLFHKKQLI